MSIYGAVFYVSFDIFVGTSNFRC